MGRQPDRIYRRLQRDRDRGAGVSYLGRLFTFEQIRTAALRDAELFREQERSHLEAYLAEFGHVVDAARRAGTTPGVIRRAVRAMLERVCTVDGWEST